SAINYFIDGVWTKQQIVIHFVVWPQTHAMDAVFRLEEMRTIKGPVEVDSVVARFMKRNRLGTSSRVGNEDHGRRIGTEPFDDLFTVQFAVFLVAQGNPAVERKRCCILQELQQH